MPERGQKAIGPMRAHQLLGVFALRIAPALTAGAIVYSHTRQIGDALIVAAAMVAVARTLDPGRELARLMPLAGLINRMLIPLAGIGLAWLVCLPLRPLALAELP